MSYNDQFIRSVEFLERFDKKCRRETWGNDNIATEIENNILDKELRGFLNAELKGIASRYIQSSTVSFVNQCHSISQQFYEHWSTQEIGKLAPVYITIGTVEYKGQEVYSVSRSSVKKIISKGFRPEDSLDVHVWLTFSNMTVLDLTIIPTLISKGLAVSANFDDSKYIIWEEGNDSDLKYIPILQYNKFMHAVDRYKY